MIAPPAALAAWVNTFYIVETGPGRIEETMPAFTAQLMVLVQGGARIVYPAGRTDEFGRVSINAPQLRSAAAVLEGPALVVGASFSPLGWQALSNLAADIVHDRLIAASAVLRPQQIGRLEQAASDCAAGRLHPEALCDALGTVISAAPFPLRPDHVEVIEAMTAWLASGFDPPLSALHEAVPISPRQLQRISRRFYGVAPAQVLKRHRAIKAAILLANPDLRAQRDEMLDTYFDQAHLIRDIRRYTGRTPTQLRAPSLLAGLFDPAGHGPTAALLRKVDA
jgi:AraC-like DNA-binding protein